MNRREALKSLTALAGAAGISVTPVTTHEAADAALVILRCDTMLARESSEQLAAAWKAACESTALEHVKVLVLSEGLTVEVVRK